MKKILLTLFFAIISAISWAYDVEIDGIYYNLVNKAKIAEVTRGNNSYSGDIILPDSIIVDGIYYTVTTIEHNTFDNCRELTSITIPKSIVRIGYDAFNGYNSLSSVYIFDLKSWLGISFESGNSNPLSSAHHLYLNGEEVKDLIIPDSEETIGDNVFYGWRELLTITIPNSVTSIGKWAFSGCSSLQSLDLPDSLKTIGYGAFDSCHGLTTLTIGNSIESIGMRAFYNCSNLQKVELGNSLKTIGSFCFEECSRLLSVKIGNSVFEIENSAFKNCSSLKSIIIPNSVKYIDQEAFSGCSSLNTINLGSGIKYIYYKAFAKCLDLEKVICNAVDVPFTLTSAFADSYIEYASLYVPDNSVETYKAADQWKDFGTIKGLSEMPYDLSYYVDNELYKKQTYQKGETITPEAEPTKTGYTFSGWSEIPEVMPDHDVDIYGTFSVNSYKLTYKVDGELYKEYTLDYGTPITPEAEPKKEGYVFSGWSDIPETMPDHDVTVSGTFSKGLYKLIYYVDNVKYKEVAYDFGATITPEAEPTKDGYTFSGWSDIPETMPDHDVKVYGSFTVNSYKLTYKVDGEVYKEYTKKYGATITPEAEPTKDGYTFSGWSEIPETMPAHDVEVNGYFSIITYKLIYKVDGAIYKEYDLACGEPITPEPEPTKVGYTFSGWSDIPDVMPARKVYVYGSFKINKYTITFDTDGGSEVAPITQNYGTTITPPEDPTKEGCAFAGWDPEIPETMPAENMTIKAQWTVGSYILKYKVDGVLYKEYTLKCGDPITPEPEPTKEGYTFSGWSEIPETMPARNVYVYGSFDVNKYNVSYYVNEELVHQDKVAFGKTFELWEYVPETDDITFNGWIGEVYETMPAHDISYKADITSGISYVYGNSDNIEGIYTLDGKKVEKLHQGVYVIRMKDGTTRKFISK